MEGGTPASGVQGTEHTEPATVIGVAGHRLWLQSTRSGKVLGLPKDTLSHLVAIGVLRLSTRRPDSTVSAESDETHRAAGELLNFESTDDVAAALQSFNSKCCYDPVLMSAVNDMAESMQCHPCFLKKNQLLDLSASLAANLPECPRREILLRILLLLSFNDVVAPLMPFLCAAERNHCQSSTLQEIIRTRVFTEVSSLAFII